jgi:diguanylate cyclase (GGDEF)-like protein
VRTTDHIGRYGGDEFMVVLPGVDAIEAIDIANRIIAAGHAVRSGSGCESISLSAGVAVFPAMAATRQELVDLADHAMYEAKLHHGRPAPTVPPLQAVER